MVEGSPPGDALLPTPRRATPACKGARCGAGAESARPHRPHPRHTDRRTPAARSRGRAAGGGTAPDTRRPSQRWQAGPPGGAPPPPLRHAAPTGHAGQGDSVGPHTHTPAPTARGWRTPTARPVGGQSGEGQGLTSDAPHNGGRHPPRGRPSTTPTASNAGPQGRTRWGRCWVPTPALTAPGTHGSRNPGCRLHKTSGRGRDSAGHQTPLTTVAGQPPGDGPPPSPWQAAPTGHAGQGDSVGPPHPHTRAHCTWMADPNSPPSGRAVGGGTVPDLRRPSQWLKAPPAGTPFCHFYSEHAGPQGRTPWGRCWVPTPAPTATRDTRVAEPWLPPPEDGWPGEGQRLTPDAPHKGGRHPLSGTPFRHLHSKQSQLARAHAVGQVLGPHARTDRTRDTRVAEPRLPAPEDGWPGEGQRLTPGAPHNGGRPPPPGTAPHHPRGTQPPQGVQAKGTVLGPHTNTPAPTARGWQTPTARPVGGQSEEGERLTSDAPHNGGRHPPRGSPSATPTASNAVPQGRTLWG